MLICMPQREGETLPKGRPPILLLLLQSIKTITGESYSAQPIRYKQPPVAAERIVVLIGIVQLRDGMKQRQLAENGEPITIASRRSEMDGLG